MENFESSTIEEKGYYDGMVYCLKAIRKAKQYLLKKIGREIEEKL